jgi:AbrB family looped-hinge helix DNA binding protein
METVLDKFGRVVVPKDARERLGLEPGSRLSVEVTGDAITLRLRAEEQPLLVRDGVLVYAGKLLADGASLVSSRREARLRKVRGTRRR